jgi:predicted GNAT family acetyltransferase
VTARPTAVDEPAHDRFVVQVDGATAELVYRRRGDRLVLVHTEVPESLAGEGIGGILVEGALAQAAAEALTIVPLCPFASHWLREHPDKADKVTIDWRAAGQ